MRSAINSPAENSDQASVMKRLIVDVDGTLTFHSDCDYCDKQPQSDVIAKLHEYRALGYEIVLFSSRNMRTHKGSLGKINVHTLPVLRAWLEKHDVPFDEIVMGKPWCGNDGFYIDDRAVRPDEFARMSRDEIETLINPQRRDADN